MGPAVLVFEMRQLLEEKTLRKTHQRVDRKNATGQLRKVRIPYLRLSHFVTGSVEWCGSGLRLKN